MKKIYLLLVFLLFTLTTFAQTVYKTRTGEKYHVAGCRYLKSSFETTVADALAEGLTPCSVCRPPSGGSNTSTNTPTTTTSNSLDTDNSSIQETTRTTAVQCSGTTKAGNRCRQMTTAANGRCYQH